MDMKGVNPIRVPYYQRYSRNPFYTIFYDFYHYIHLTTN
jgi:hypothetical protein